VEFRILGPLEAEDGGQLLSLGSLKQRALLTLLLLQRGEVVSRERLIEQLWDERPPPSADGTLAAYVSRLRKIVGRDRLRSQPTGYQLVIEPDELDATRFERALRSPHRDVEQTVRQLRDALALWRGPALADFAYATFAVSESRRLDELRMVALEERVAGELKLGLHATLVAELEGLVREHPLRERLREQHMLALYRCGRQADALASYQELRRVLTGELGLEPGTAAQELQRAILSHDASLALQRSADCFDAIEETSDGVFVGREAERQVLRSALDQTLRGHGRLVLIAGEPGIGKSRLADELAGDARRRGVEVLVGRCWEAGGAPPFWPWVQAIRAHLGEHDGEHSRSTPRSAAGPLAQILPELGSPVAVESSRDPDAARFQLFESISSFLRRASRTRPIALILDDLHAADASSLLLLRFLAEEIRQSPLLVVGCYRTMDPMVEEPLASTLVELSRSAQTSSIELTGLSEGDISALVELVAGQEPRDRVLAEIVRATEGNPLFVSEMVRLLAADDHLDSILDPNGRLTVPENVRAIIRLRLSRLSPKATQLLALAAVLGREFELGELKQVSGTPHAELLTVIDETAAEGIVAAAPGGRGRLRFSHALIRESLYRDLPPGRRLKLHRLVGEALETLYGGNSEPHLAELAYHFFESARPDDAARSLNYAERAAERSLRLLAYEEARRHYATALRALDIVEQPHPDVRCRLLLGLGESHLRAGESAESRAAFLAAAETARKSGQSNQLAQAALGYGGRYAWARAGADASLVALLEEALALLSHEDSALRVKLLARLAGALRDEPDPERRSGLSSEAVTVARCLRDPATLAYALNAHLFASLPSADPATRLALADELLRLASEADDAQGVFDAHDHRSSALIQLAEIQELDRTDAEMARVATRLRQPAQLWLLTTNRALRALLAGRLAEAETSIFDALEIGARAQPNESRYTFRLQLAALRKAQGRAAELEAEAEQSLEEYPNRIVFPCLLADLRCQLGNETGARALLEQIDIEALPASEEWLYAMHFLSETCAALRDVGRARILHQLLVPHARSVASLWADGNAGAVARYLGLLSATQSRFDEAVAHYELALTINGRLRARPWLAHTQADYARALLAQENPMNVPSAHRLLEDARSTYTELGMEPYAAN
jgi:DNA-binding SARP family transcriptional activator/tetratricopeptide (TPR) repeat protein